MAWVKQGLVVVGMLAGAAEPAAAGAGVAPLECVDLGGGMRAGQGTFVLDNPTASTRDLGAVTAANCSGYTWTLAPTLSPGASPFDYVVTPPADPTCTLTIPWTAPDESTDVYAVTLTAGACANNVWFEAPTRSVWRDDGVGSNEPFVLHNDGLSDAMVTLDVQAPYTLFKPDPCAIANPCSFMVNAGSTIGVSAVISPVAVQGAGPHSPIQILLDGGFGVDAPVTVRGVLRSTDRWPDPTLAFNLGGGTPLDADVETIVVYSDIPVAQATFDGAAREDFAIGGFDCSPPAGVCVPANPDADYHHGMPLTVTFAPTATGIGQTKLSFATPPGQALAVPLDYAADDATWTLMPLPGTEADPTELTASVCPGTSWRQGFDFVNTGSVPLSMAVTMVSLDPAWSLLAPGAYAEVGLESTAKLDLLPTAAVGPHATQIIWNVTGDPLAVYDVMVNVVTDLAVGPGELTFADALTLDGVTVGTPERLDVAVTACLPGASLIAISVPPGFTTTATPGSLTDGEPLLIDVTFAPTAAGDYTGELALTFTDANDNMLSQRVQLSGHADEQDLPPVDGATPVSYYACATSGGAAGAALPVLLAVGLVRRRRRVRS